ncbi:S-methyl-5-thioribose kinase [Rhabdobacter roseus]|uniref:5-methylthioribose kinase n=1 Tax=Rhabdobacter roseus TaxID=1655419 RepID=A0A840TSW8_9BACT|nr:phosphotransferase [Rhabdobacter roseus]MBB5285985.1 5-methylthioribose kinase [Rhabdobacter roseus]
MLNKKERFQKEFPRTFFLDAQDEPSLQEFLHDRGWIEPYESVLWVQKPGEGNMNYVLRVKTEARSFIIKQARSWVEKYPQLDAPVERAAVEARFFQQANKVPALRPYLPQLLEYSAPDFLLMIEDLGQATDYTFLYQKDQVLDPEVLGTLVTFLKQLHSQTEAATAGFPPNQTLRQLNAEHMFKYPYLPDNGLNLDDVQPGLAAVARRYQQDEALHQKVQALADSYLGSGSTLLHGDYYPGSWLHTASGPKVIDPEFGYLGRAEFDLGVLLAHLHLAQQPESTLQEALEGYLPGAEFDLVLCKAFCGAEIIRRLIGLAQLPLALTLEEKEELLEKARGYVLVRA